MSARPLVLRSAGLSLRLERRPLAVAAALACGCLAALVAGVAVGEYAIAPADVIAALLGAGEQAVGFIVVDLRLPRALTALLAGAALGIAGTIFQDLARNPLVSPDIVGISWGAALAAVSLIIAGGDSGTLSVPLAALGGGLGAGALLYGLAWRSGVDGYRLVLIGIGLSALFSAAVSYVLTRGQILDAAQAYIWLIGSLNGRSWEHVWPLAVVLALSLALLPALARHLAALQLGPDLARGLGTGVERSRLGLLAVAIVLTAVAVAAAGPIGFVAFIAPHIARRLSRTAAPGAVLANAALVGALLVAAADLAGRFAFEPSGIPVGIVTSILAAPYFLYLLRRSRHVEGVA